MTVFPALLFGTGCTALEQRETQAWLALHAVDTAQTFRIAGDPACYSEGGEVTRRLIGRHPSDAEVAAWSLGTAALHLAATDWLLRNDHPRAATVLQYVHIGISASAVANNYSIGIRIGSPNQRGDCAPQLETETPIETPRPIR